VYLVPVPITYERPLNTLTLSSLIREALESVTETGFLYILVITAYILLWNEIGRQIGTSAIGMILSAV